MKLTSIKDYMEEETKDRPDFKAMREYEASLSKSVQAMKALFRIFKLCEEIDFSLPEEERKGYRMIDDWIIINGFIFDNMEQSDIEKLFTFKEYKA